MTADRKLLTTLVAEMKVPGSAVLEFEVVRDGNNRCRLATNARFHPSGLLGLLYWYALLPLHRQFFENMPRGPIKYTGDAGAARRLG
ncbi:MAG: DUF2867 domain-containing protein [Tepidiformaceae bacterium]